MKLLMSIIMFLTLIGCAKVETVNDNEYYMEKFELSEVKFNFNKMSFDEFTENTINNDFDGLVIVVKQDCEYCHTLIKKVTDILNEEHKSNLVVNILESDQLNASEKMELIEEYYVSSVPTTIIYTDGKLSEIEVGIPSDERITDIINKI